MKTQLLFSRGSRINKVQWSLDLEDILTEIGFDVNYLFNEMADENEYIYVSNGFLNRINKEYEDGEWHHFFKKDSFGTFDAFRLSFETKQVIN